MEYTKKALIFEDQADKLLSRGLIADRDELMSRLSAVNYYRLSGYLHPFREKESEQFKEGTSLNKVWDRYCFDRRLRVMVLDAIERIEVSLRTKLVYLFSHQYGPFGYCDDQNLPKLKMKDFLDWRLSLQEETNRSKETFKTHFFAKYGTSHKVLPLWMLAELMSMGSLLTFYKGSSPQLKRQVAGEFGFSDELLHSWLRSLNAARNICAHHGRFWNRTLGYPPLLPKPKRIPEWHGDTKPRTDRSGVILLICRDMLRKISPTSKWHERVEALLDEYPEIPIVSMGLPEDWKNHPIWKQDNNLPSTEE